MFSKTKFSQLLGVGLVLALLLSGCAKAQPAGLTDQQLASLTENILKSLDANDYQAFTQDFSDAMLAAFPQANFDQLQTLLAGASGSFVSLGKPPALSNNQGYALYRFTSTYSNETVYVTLSFLIGGQKVEGLWFDSANLRKAQ